MNDCLYRFNDPDHIVTYKTYDKHSTLWRKEGPDIIRV